MKQPKLIALDCDDVLLDYNKAWGKIYSDFFNLNAIQPTNTRAYHADKYWGIDWINRKEEEKKFLQHFHNHGWKNMEALDGAIEGTKLLRKNGYKIFIISRMPESVEKDRTENLKKLGFEFDSVIGTGHSKDKNHNPKKSYIEALRPDYFVDDLVANFHGINATTKFVWLDLNKQHQENDDLRKKIKIHHIHKNLLSFVTTIV